MPGRPKPTRLKVLEGNPGRRDLPDDEPHLPASGIAPPDELEPAARRSWEQLVPHLERVGLLSIVDELTLAGLCTIRARLLYIWKRLRAKSRSDLLEHYTTVEGEPRVRAHPYTVMERQYLEIWRKYASEFGLSPRGRVGLQVGKRDSDDGEDLLS